MCAAVDLIFPTKNSDVESYLDPNKVVCRNPRRILRRTELVSNVSNVVGKNVEYWIRCRRRIRSWKLLGSY